jgi:hypothetical protein
MLERAPHEAERTPVSIGQHTTNANGRVPMNLHSILFWALWAAWIIMEIVVNLRARSLRK